MPDLVRHPKRQNTALSTDQTEILLEWLREMDNITLLHQAKTWQWLADTRGYDEFAWGAKQCRAELRRRKLAL